MRYILNRDQLKFIKFFGETMEGSKTWRFIPYWFEEVERGVVKVYDEEEVPKNIKELFIGNTKPINFKLKNMKAKIVVVDGGKPPYKKHSTDSCWDRSARKIERISDHLVKVYLGVRIQPPEGHEVKLYARSHFGEFPWVLGNHIGVGDESYRGEYVAFFNPIPVFKKGEESFIIPRFPYKVGDRCIQFQFQKKESIELDLVDELNDTERGEGGFGSTGRV